MDKVTEYLKQAPQVPQPLQWALAGLGAVVAFSKLWSFLTLVLSSFVLPGTNVSRIQAIAFFSTREMNTDSSISLT